MGTPTDFGAVVFFTCDAELLVKDESALVPSPSGSVMIDSEPETPIINTCASHEDSWFGVSRPKAFCVAARAVGDGGRGAGFMA